MTNAKTIRVGWMLPCLMLLGVVLAGCGGLSQKYPEKRFYVLRLGEPEVAVEKPVTKEALRVQRVRMAKPYDGTAFVYRVGPSQLQADYYNGFITTPDEILTGELTRWLRAAQLFPTAFTASSSAHYGYTLESAITGLYGDYTDPKQPKAVIEMTVCLLQDESLASHVVLYKNYQEAEPLQADTPAALVSAWETAYRRLLGALAGDLRTTLVTASASD